MLLNYQNIVELYETYDERENQRVRCTGRNYAKINS